MTRYCPGCKARGIDPVRVPEGRDLCLDCECIKPMDWIEVALGMRHKLEEDHSGKIFLPAGITSTHLSERDGKRYEIDPPFTAEKAGWHYVWIDQETGKVGVVHEDNTKLPGLRGPALLTREQLGVD